MKSTTVMKWTVLSNVCCAVVLVKLYFPRVDLFFVAMVLLINIRSCDFYIQIISRISHCCFPYTHVNVVLLKLIANEISWKFLRKFY